MSTPGAAMRRPGKGSTDARGGIDDQNRAVRTSHTNLFLAPAAGRASCVGKSAKLDGCGTLGLETRVRWRAQMDQAIARPRVFPGLVPYGPDGKLSGRFSGDFSRQKIKLGIGPKTVFHSFRHSVRAILTNKPASAFRDAWIDSVMGHSSDDKRVDEHGARNRASAGEVVYNKEIYIRNMLTVVEAIEYPEEVELVRIRNSLLGDVR